MDSITKAAVITWLLDRKIKVVHLWEGSDGLWSCMVETPPCGKRAGALTYPSDQKVGTGLAKTPIGALVAALGKVGGVTLEFRVHLLTFIVDHIINRAGPALLRRIEGGS